MKSLFLIGVLSLLSLGFTAGQGQDLGSNPEILQSACSVVQISHVGNSSAQLPSMEYCGHSSGG